MPFLTTAERFPVGTLVRITAESDYRGQLATVAGATPSGFLDLLFSGRIPTIRLFLPSEVEIVTTSTAVPFRAEASPMPVYQIGDRVRVIDRNHRYYALEATITNVEEIYSIYDLSVSGNGLTTPISMRPEYFQPVSDTLPPIEYVTCASCGDDELDPMLYTTDTIDGDPHCEQCASEWYNEHTCEECGDITYGRHNGMCESCYEYANDQAFEQYGSETIHDYSYTPKLVFHTADGSSYEPDPNTPYLGLELEISVSDRAGAAESITRDSDSDIIFYLKEDSSVKGFELVTHPATLEAHKANLPFAGLRTLRKDYNASAYANGIHVHVSRAGFSSDLHVFRWMKLIYRNEADVTRHADRDVSEWAAFRPSDRTAQRTTARKTGAYQRYANRYAAINTLNADTFEVRVFRGSLQRTEILAHLELVAASVEYTRQLTSEAIRNGSGWTWSKFIAWAAKQGDTYTNLVAYDLKTLPEPAQLTLALDTDQPRPSRFVTVTSDSGTPSEHCDCSSCTLYQSTPEYAAAPF